MTKEQLEKTKELYEEGKRIERKIDTYKYCKSKIEDNDYISSNRGEVLLRLYGEPELQEIIKTYCDDMIKALEEEFENL